MLRRNRRLTQEELAHTAGLHVTYLSSLERGLRNPTLNVLVDIARALKMPLWKLVQGVDKS